MFRTSYLGNLHLYDCQQKYNGEKGIHQDKNEYKNILINYMIIH